jgi:hypothetical protein
MSTDKPKDVNWHNGGDFKVFTQKGEIVETFPSVEDAVESMVAAWHECDVPEAFTIRANGITVATICPIGSDSIMVVRSNGDTMIWTHIHYVMVDGQYDHTSAYLNNIEYRFTF